MQKANISYNTLQDCLQQLQELDLVELHPNTLEYVTTKKGITFLVKWMQLQEFLMPNEKVSIRAKKVFSHIT
jgi:predicted transcriptional regulator